MAEACADVGLDNVAAGFSNLSKKERTFTLEYLRTANATEAARLAGYSSPSADGAKVKQHAGVRAVLVQCALPIAKNADQLVRRASERSRALHALFDAELNKPETLRNQSTLIKLAAAVDKTDGLLGSLLGKITGGDFSTTVNVNGGTGITVPDEALMAFAQLRRENLLRQHARAQQAVNTGGEN